MKTLLHKSKKLYLSKLFSTQTERKNISNPVNVSLNLQAGNLENLKENDNVNNFKIEKISHHHKFEMKSFILKHNYSDLKIHHLSSIKEINNSFTFHFRTPAFDNTGVFHILEHLTLAGSKKYLERDPFFKMNKRSLKTYMNAWTGPDFTMYPFATANEQDYKNLREVYYNSVFHPRLDYLDFLQEGWRLEKLNSAVNDHNNENVNLVFNGVVLNEMKGAMINPENQYIHYLHKHLFPESTYSFNSGGDPEFITNLKYEDLIKVHKNYYNINNCSIITYGSQGIESDTNFISNNLEKDFSLKNNDKKWYVNDVKPFKSPNHQIEYYQPDLLEQLENEKKEFDFDLTNPTNQTSEATKSKSSEDWKFGISFYTNDVTTSKSGTHDENSYLTFKLSILSQLLTEGPGAPFYKNFLEKNLAPNYIHGYGYDHSLKFGVLTLGFMGFPGNNTHLNKIENGILNTLKEVSEKGFTEKQINEVLHLVEYDFLKPKSDFGIGIYEKSVCYFTHSDAPFTVLDVPLFIERLKKEIFIDKKPIFQDLIREKLLENNHRVHLTIKPKKTLAVDNNKIESNKLKLLESKITKDEILKITEDNKNLINYQNIEDNVELLEEKKNNNKEIQELPNLDLTSISETVEEVRYSKLKTIFNIPFYFFQQNTNGLSFMRFKFNIKNIPSKYKKLLSLYSYLLPKLGTKNTKYEEFQNRLLTISGGLNISHVIDSCKNDESESIENICFEFSFLNSNLEKAFNSLSELLSSPDFFDVENVNNLIKQKSIEIANQITENSLFYAKEEAIEGLRPYKKDYNFYKQDLELLKLGTDIIKNSDPKLILNQVIEDLIILHNLITIKDNITVGFHGDKSKLGSIEQNTALLLNTIKNENPVFNRELLNIEKVNLEGELFTTEKIINKSENLDQLNSSDVQILEDINELEKSIINDKKDSHISYKKLVVKTPSQVSDCCESVMIPSFNHPDHAKLYLAANLINLKYLHKDIREQGGAYGSGASFKSGCCSFFSYRDPNPHKTFEHFEQAIIKASKGKFTDNDIKEAKLFVFSQIDHIVAPQNKGLDIFLNGITFEEKNIFRKRLLQVKKEDIQEVVNKYFVKQMKLGITSRSLFGKINDPSENEIDDYFLQNDWKITNSLTFLSDMYFEEKLDN